MTHRRFSPAARRIQGTTLIEVMVSMFLLTFGVLGLMAAQIRSVVSISEAESRTTIAQAAEMLAEGMLANPTVVDNKGQAIRRYTNYTTGRTNRQTIDLTSDSTLPEPLWGKWGSTGTQKQDKINKQDLANQQLTTFEHMLRQTPNAGSLQYVICEDTTPPRQPAVDANGNITSGQCNGAGNPGSAVIKVVWTSRPAKEKDNAQKTIYTYLLQVQE